ncbi:MAG: SMC-Scp complex subunit ScpB [Clostridiales bacterium]|jgi:segregation and condensation protein B|nr:SMC-Scp complex subunit ScpB [Clostridiales bacterium]
MINIDMIDEVLEALLFVSGNGLKIEEIAGQLELQKSEVNAAVKRLKEKYGGKSGIHLLVYNHKVQLASNPAYQDVIAGILNPIKERELSAAVLETAAIIAYRQPVTRTEIEMIRGVSSEYSVQVLLNHNLIEVVGRKDAVGKPLLFGTTDNFLKRFQVEDITQLPDYDQLLESIRVIEASFGAAEQAEDEQKALYNEFEIPEGADEPLPEFLEGEADVKRIDAAEAAEGVNK